MVFQVLCEQRFDWVPASDGHIPEGAVEGGRTCDGEPLYIGRAHHHGSLTVGKVGEILIEIIPLFLYQKINTFVYRLTPP